jgi:hypothetical protein
MREMRPYGSVRGVPGDRHPYRDSGPAAPTLMKSYGRRGEKVNGYLVADGGPRRPTS